MVERLDTCDFSQPRCAKCERTVCLLHPGSRIPIRETMLYDEASVAGTRFNVGWS